MIVILMLLCCSCSSANQAEAPAAFDNSNNTNYLVAIDSLGRVMQSKATGNEKKGWNIFFPLDGTALPVQRYL